MVKKRSSINLSLSDYEKQQLEALAAQFNIYWGEKPNISELLKRIVQGKLRVVANDDWPQDRIDMLNHIRGLLIDRGNIQEAITIAEMLLDRSELKHSLRRELNLFVAKPSFPWRITIEKLCEQFQPFRLSYQDAADRLLDFHIYYAKITPHDDREYLDCWCEETEGNQDLPQLNHNWCLRLDRIPEETAITEISGHWRHLDFIEVEFHLLNNLAFAYRTKNNVDEVNQWHPDREKVRRVIRKVTNTFWFLREIRRYGSDCVVVSPPALRDRVQKDYQESLKVLKAYE